MGFSLEQASFTGGELAPSLHSRTDLAKYAVGLAECRNFFIHAHGGVSNRPGFEFVAGTKYDDKESRLIPFEFSTLQTYAMEFGDLYLRVVKGGGQVLYPAGHAQENQIVEIATPYTEADLAQLKFVQSADVMTIVHPNHVPRELKRSDHHEWALTEITFLPVVGIPGNLSASASGSVKYLVTAVADETHEESLPSSEVSGSTTCTLNFSAVSGAQKYNVYKEKNGIFGYIGSTEDTSYVCEDVKPILDDTPPKARNPFTGAEYYPASVSYFQQRLVFGGSLQKPQTIWTTQTGNYSNMNTSSPTKDDDAITFTIAARRVNQIRHLVPLKSLVVLTSGGEWVMTGDQDGVLTPTSVSIDSEGERGASDVPPLVIGSAVLYCQSRGSIVRDLAYSFQNDGYAGGDLSVLSNHLFQGYEIKEWCYAQSPDSIVWCVRNDGVLLGLTYMKEHEVWGWHQHHTAGQVESICSIPEGDEDAVYTIVKRTLGGQEKRYIERLHTRKIKNVEDSFFVDSGLSYSGSPVTTLSGLSHLEGEAVSVLADGDVVNGLSVSGGQITLPSPASKVIVGLPYLSRIQALRINFETKELGSTTGKQKSITAADIHFLQSRGGSIGTNTDNLQEILQRTDEDWGDPTNLQTGVFHIDMDPDWDTNGQVMLEQSDPLPMTVLSITPEITIA